MRAALVDDVFLRIFVDVNGQIFQLAPEQAKLFQCGEQRLERTKPGEHGKMAELWARVKIQILERSKSSKRGQVAELLAAEKTELSKIC
jgi:hypothetical protein